jgi:hypothetical protein
MKCLHFETLVYATLLRVTTKKLTQLSRTFALFQKCWRPSGGPGRVCCLLIRERMMFSLLIP